MKRLTRDFQPEVTLSDENIITMSVASSAPCERDDKNIGTYDEVLVISEDAINSERLVDQRCPFLYEHDTDKQIGVVERHYIADGKLYVVVRFSDNFEAQEVLNDIKSGIRRNCSIGYIVNEMKMFSSPDKANPTGMVTRWTPYECSSVSCPADFEVGYQRSLDKEDSHMKKHKRELELTDEELKKLKDLLAESDDDDKAEEAESEEATAEEAEEPEETKTEEKSCEEETKAEDEPDAETPAEEPEKKSCEEDEIRSLGDLLSKRDLAEEYIKNKRSLAEFKDAIRTKSHENKEVTNMTTQRFSLRKAILNAAGRLSDEEAKFERDIIAENKRKFNVSDADIVLSKNEIRAFDGQEALNQTVYQPGMYTPNLRPAVTVDAIGTQKVAVTGPSISFSVCTSGINAGFVDINGDVPSATMDFTLKTMSPKKQGGFVDVSYQSLLQDDPSAEGLIMDDIVKALDQNKDYVFWNGLAANNEPVGILNVDGLNTVTLPDSPTLSTALAFEKAIRDSYDYSANLKWVMGSEAYYKWAATPYSAIEQNRMLIDPDTRKCIGYDVYLSPAMPASAIILGNFGEALEADFDGLTLKIVTEATNLARKQACEIIAHRSLDFLVRRPKSFCKSL